jgi:hypothetical protein
VILAAAFVGFAAWLVATLHQRKSPLLVAVPFAVAFPPFLWYASGALGWPFGGLSTRVALVGCIALFVAHRIIMSDFSWRRAGGHWVVMPHVTLVTASVIWGVLGVGAGNADQMANEFVTWILPVCVFALIAASPRGEADLAIASRALLFTVVVAGGLAFSQVSFFMGREDLVPAQLLQVARQVRDETWFGSFRVYGTFPTIGPNMFGTFLLIPAVILLSRAAGASGRARLGWGVGGLLAIAMIVATLSRGAQLGLVAALALLPFWRRSWRTGGAVVVLAFLSVLVAAGTTAGVHALRLFAGGELDVDALERLNIWRAILREAPSHPLGFGFNGWLRVSGQLVDVGIAGGANTVGSGYPAENQWLRELADRGLLGVGALIVLIGGLLIVTYRAAGVRTASSWHRDFMAGAGAGIAGFAVAMLTGDHLTYDNVAGMFWFIAALVLSGAGSLDDAAPAAGPGGVDLSIASHGGR